TIPRSKSGLLYGKHPGRQLKERDEHMRETFVRLFSLKTISRKQNRLALCGKCPGCRPLKERDGHVHGRSEGLFSLKTIFRKTKQPAVWEASWSSSSEGTRWACTWEVRKIVF